MRRGLTIIELLLALSLLTVIMLAVASWTQTTASATAKAAEPGRWRAAGEAVLQLIHDDLAIGDFGTNDQGPRVKIIDGDLQIRTRAAPASGFVGSITHRYEYHAPSHELALEQLRPDGRRHTRLLVDRVDRWKCEIDDEQRVLTITIGLNTDLEIAREYVLP